MRDEALAARRSNAYICITAELAAALGPIGAEHSSNCSIVVRWDDEDPENIWRVEVSDFTHNGVWDYLVDDQTGEISPEPSVWAGPSRSLSQS